jgi:hypothetical protein
LIAIGFVIYIEYGRHKAETQKAKDIKMEEHDTSMEREPPFICTCGSPVHYSDLWSEDAYAHGCIAEFTCQKGHIFTRVGEKSVDTRV